MSQSKKTKSSVKRNWKFQWNPPTVLTTIHLHGIWKKPLNKYLNNSTEMDSWFLSGIPSSREGMWYLPCHQRRDGPHAVGRGEAAELPMQGKSAMLFVSGGSGFSWVLGFDWACGSFLLTSDRLTLSHGASRTTNPTWLLCLLGGFK